MNIANLKRIRKEKGLTQKALSELTGIAESTIRRYEAKTLNPKISTLEKLAAGLGVTVYELMDEDFYKNLFRDVPTKRLLAELERRCARGG